MSKKGVSMISGNISPIVGEKQTYHIVGWYPDTPKEERDPGNVTWELFRKRSNGKFSTTNIKKKGDSSFTFGEASLGNTYRLEGYLHRPEGGGIIITPKPSKIPQINKVGLFYVDDTRGSMFSFMEKLRARAYCCNMFNKELVFTLWEDDAIGSGHHKSNKAIDSQKAKVNKNGIAVAEFMLTKALTKKAMQGEVDSKQLEFYVTVEYYKSKKHATENVEIDNPYAQYYKPKPYEPPVTPKAKGSPAEQKPKSRKEERGILDAVTDQLTDLWDWQESKGTITKDKTPTVRKPEGRSVVVVKGQETSKKNNICICQSYDLIWGQKVSCEFRKKVVEIANTLGKDPNLLMAGMALETGRTFSPTAGAGTSYVGLIQFGDLAAESVGTTISALLKMTDIQQLHYVEKYLQKKKDKINTLTDFYLSILMPIDVGKGNQPNYTVFDNKYPLEYSKKGILTDLSKSRHYGYRQNPAFFFEGELHKKIKIKRSDGKYQVFKELHDEKKVWYENGEKKYEGEGKTYIWEIEKSISKFYEDGKNHKAKVFECQKESKQDTLPSTEKDTWNVIITEHYTGKMCTHIEMTPIRNNCRRGKIEVYDHNGKIVFTISDCLLEGIAGEDRMIKDSDAPFGTYKISASPFIMGSLSGDKRTSYGPNPRLSFEPILGHDDEAAKSGRSLIRIHGGRQETKKFQPRPNPVLLRTHGCIRIWDADAKRFYEWWRDYHKSNPEIRPGKLKIIK
ncbi:L,D-transpeptidase family protein [Chryseobacterium taeanense]|nr:L,D-transpeptidase [Chryseobacterium taeanense]